MLHRHQNSNSHENSHDSFHDNSHENGLYLSLLWPRLGLTDVERKGLGQACLQGSKTVITHQLQHAFVHGDDLVTLFGSSACRCCFAGATQQETQARRKQGGPH